MDNNIHPFGRKKHRVAYIDPLYCIGCGRCAGLCVTDCIRLRDDGFYTVEEEHCIGCKSCLINCFWDAVTMTAPREENE